MYQDILKHVIQKGYFNSHKKVLVAVSGGVDSMNLLHFLHSYRDKLEIDIGIAHINHKQRLASEEEEEYLRKWALRHNIPFFVDYFQGDFSEEKSRTFRYSVFRKIMKEKGYTALVTAHHADDNQETILMRLIRGSRLRHLVGISEVSGLPEGELIRPLLSFKKSDLPNPFHFEDATNSGLDYLRNRVRNHYLPLLKKENPQFATHLQYLSEEVSTMMAALSELTKAFDIEDRRCFSNLSFPVQTVLLQQYLQQFPDLQLSKSQFNQLLNVMTSKTNSEYYIKAGYWLLLRPDKAAISKIIPKTDSQNKPKVLDYESKVEFNGFHFEFRAVDTEDDGISVSSLSPIVLRHRQSGDQITLGHYTKKIRRLFIDDKVSIEERRNAIIGEQDGEIIFVITSDKTYLRKLSKNVTIKAKLYIQKEIG